MILVFILSRIEHANYVNKIVFLLIHSGKYYDLLRI